MAATSVMIGSDGTTLWLEQCLLELVPDEQFMVASRPTYMQTSSIKCTNHRVFFTCVMTSGVPSPFLLR
jgi:hypothetical protein